MIVIDGVDGAGKGVQTRLLADAIRAAGHEVVLTREPGGSPGAEDIRKLLVEGEPERWDVMTELLLMYAARRAHLVETVWPAIQRGSYVVSDRFADSSMAFQGIAGNARRETVQAVHELVVGSFAPDLTIILDIDPETSLERAKARGGNDDRFEKKSMDYHQRVRAAFKEIADADPFKHVVIDAAASIEQVESDINCVLAQRLDLKLGAAQ